VRGLWRFYGFGLSGEAISQMRVRGIWLADKVAAEAIRLAGE